MKRILIIACMAAGLVYCNTPEPTTTDTPNNTTDTMGNNRVTDTTGRTMDTTARRSDTLRLQN